jgi:hypothetical protein
MTSVFAPPIVNLLGRQAVRDSVVRANSLSLISPGELGDAQFIACPGCFGNEWRLKVRQPAHRLFKLSKDHDP